MPFTLTIDTDNAAFEEREPNEELARIITQTAKDVLAEAEEGAVSFSFAVVDANGNIVGRAELIS